MVLLGIELLPFLSSFFVTVMFVLVFASVFVVFYLTLI